LESVSGGWKALDIVFQVLVFDRSDV
jgi:hypothetical protein